MTEPMAGQPPAPTSSDDLPAALRDAFWRYETAILADNVPVLDMTFASGPDTLRGDSAGLLVGHDAIAAFRGTRGGVASRTIERLEYRRLADDAAVVVSISRYAAGGTGLQTQVWQHIAGQWQIIAAHVTPRPQPLDRTIWRTVGDPLFQGAWEGPLQGLTVAVKDLFAIAGYRIGAGNPAFLDSQRAETTTAPAVADLLRAGASLRGIARTDEFAYSIAGENVHYGTPPNGAVPGALPGGSSNGPASAVAAGQADIGLGSDTAGSVRVPASYQGLWGLRTTHGLVPQQGVLPLAQSFDTVGWLTRDGDTLQKVADWCLAYDGPEPAAAETEADESPRGRWSESSADLPWEFVVPMDVLQSAEPATQAAFEDLLARLTRGSDAPAVTRVSLGAFGDFFVHFRVVQAAEAWHNHGDWLRAHPGTIGPGIAERFEAAATVTPAQEASARAALAPLRDRMRALVDGAVLLMPTAPGPAPARGLAGVAMDAVRTATLRITTPAAVAGLPALSIPLLTVQSPLGLAPVGVSLVSREGTDIALIRLGRRLAAAVRQERSA